MGGQEGGPKEAGTLTLWAFFRCLASSPKAAGSILLHFLHLTVMGWMPGWPLTLWGITWLTKNWSLVAGGSFRDRLASQKPNRNTS